MQDEIQEQVHDGDLLVSHFLSQVSARGPVLHRVKPLAPCEESRGQPADGTKGAQRLHAAGKALCHAGHETIWSC